jgi:uncharacterized protein involved in copper resistance
MIPQEALDLRDLILEEAQFRKEPGRSASAFEPAAWSPASLQSRRLRAAGDCPRGRDSRRRSNPHFR